MGDCAARGADLFESIAAEASWPNGRHWPWAGGVCQCGARGAGLFESMAAGRGVLRRRGSVWVDWVGGVVGGVAASCSQAGRRAADRGPRHGLPRATCGRVLSYPYPQPKPPPSPPQPTHLHLPAALPAPCCPPAPPQPIHLQPPALLPAPCCPPAPHSPPISTSLRSLPPAGDLRHDPGWHHGQAGQAGKRDRWAQALGVEAAGAGGWVQG